METYERLICELGHCLLTKGLNNDFTPSGGDLEMDVSCSGVGGRWGVGGGHKEPAEKAALTITLPDRHSQTSRGEK